MKEYVKEHLVGVIVVSCIAVLFLLFHLLFFMAETSGFSMKPTCNNGDMMLARRIKSVKDGDIVVIWSEQLQELLCKRVVATKGDTIEIVDGIVKINGEEIVEDFNNDTTSEYRETYIEKGEVFVMGDNRNNSTDSRDLGTLKIKDIRGVIVFNSHIPYKYMRIFMILLFISTVVYLMYYIWSLTKSVEVYNPYGYKILDSRLSKYKIVTRIYDLRGVYCIVVDKDFKTNVKPSSDKKYGHPLYKSELLKKEYRLRLRRYRNEVSKV